MGAFAICKFGRCGASYDAEDPRARDGLCPYCARAQEEEETGSSGGISQPTMPLDRPRDSRKWGWCIEGNEDAHGPFGSRVETIDDAMEYFLDDSGPGIYEICIGRCEYPDPAMYIGRHATKKEMGDLMYEMDESAFGDFMIEDQIFYERKGAAEAYEKALTDWASQYLYSDCWMLANDKKIKICVKEDDS